VWWSVRFGVWWEVCCCVSREWSGDICVVEGSVRFVYLRVLCVVFSGGSGDLCVVMGLVLCV
jgi:hypothetical protein